MKKKKISTDGNADQGLVSSPFDQLSGIKTVERSLPPASEKPTTIHAPKKEKKNRGRVELRREKAGRGGKTVTTLTFPAGIALSEKKELLSSFKKKWACGGCLRDGVLEIQGDLRDEISTQLEEIRFKPVHAGG